MAAKSEVGAAAMLPELNVEALGPFSAADAVGAEFAGAGLVVDCAGAEVAAVGVTGSFSAPAVEDPRGSGCGVVSCLTRTTPGFDGVLV